MSILTSSSYNSKMRGYDYFRDKKVLNLKKIDDTHYESTVKGSGDNIYSVKIDTVKNSNCSCNCPFAYGKRTICKHMVATLFTAYPGLADDFYMAHIYPEELELIRRKKLEDMVRDKLISMDKDEVIKHFLEYLSSSSDFELESFAYRMGIDYDISPDDEDDDDIDEEDIKTN